MRRALLVAWAVVLCACGPEPTELAPPPEELGLEPFYKKYVDADGIPVVSSEWVPDEALHEARRLVVQLLSVRPDVRLRMISREARVGVVGKGEVVTDLPEYRDLYETFPGTDWDRRARGLGGVIGRPLSSAPEENLLCYAGDWYDGESVLIHELAHGMMNLGLREDEPEFEPQLSAALDRWSAGPWAETYAATDVDELWAEAAQSWFDTNLDAPPVHGDIDTRQELRDADPELARMLEAVFGDSEWRYACPDRG